MVVMVAEVEMAVPAIMVAKVDMEVMGIMVTGVVQGAAFMPGIFG
jgi:hypothetical protein